MRQQNIRQEIDIDAVLFDDRPIPFEVVEGNAEGGRIRLRIRVPRSVRPGAHEISVLSSVARAEVPDVLGLTLQAARRELEASGLEIDTGVFGAASNLAVHTVSGQDPAGGTAVRPGSRVLVAVDSRTEVPEILGLSLEQAKHRLEEHGLGIATAAPVPEAVVSMQDPAAGTTVRTGTRITVRQAFAIPNLLGMRIDLVRPSLLELGLVPLVVIRDPADGPFETVLAQEPAAGLLVPAGTGVTVAVEGLPDPPPPRWPWPWVVAVVALSAGLGMRVKARRAVHQGYRVEAHHDLDRLRASVSSPSFEGREIGLDIRLLARPDPGRQTIEIDGPLCVGEPGR